MIELIRHVAVVIPACNEEATIVQALASVQAACDELGSSTSSNCVVVLDACLDGTEPAITEGVSAGLLRPPLIVSTNVRCAGAARALGVNAALEQTHYVPSEIWLANTDADTTVPREWLTDQLALAHKGAIGVAGIVDLDDDADEHLRTGFRSRYLVGRDGTHRHVHGANIAMRADAYVTAGGWHSLHTGEDHHLWHRLRSLGSCVSSTSIVVRTASRLTGRAPAGFADHLLAISQAGTVA